MQLSSEENYQAGLTKDLQSITLVGKDIVNWDEKSAQMLNIILFLGILDEHSVESILHNRLMALGELELKSIAGLLKKPERIKSPATIAYYLVKGDVLRVGRHRTGFYDNKNVDAFIDKCYDSKLLTVVFAQLRRIYCDASRLRLVK